MWTLPTGAISHDFLTFSIQFVDLWTLLEQNAVCGQSPEGPFFENIPLPVSHKSILLFSRLEESLEPREVMGLKKGAQELSGSPVRGHLKVQKNIPSARFPTDLDIFISVCVFLFCQIHEP